jgi:hypothetical protein
LCNIKFQLSDRTVTRMRVFLCPGGKFALIFCIPSIRYFSYLWICLPRSLFSTWSKSKILFAYLNPMYARYMSGQSIKYCLITLHVISLHSIVNCICVFGRWELHDVTSATTKTILCVQSCWNSLPGHVTHPNIGTW